MLLRRHRNAVKPRIEKTEKREPTIEEMQEVFNYTKSEINGMKTADLQMLGAKLGIEDAEQKTGSTLKSEIVEILNL